MRDRMPPEMLARAKGQAHNTNKRNQLAEVANGFGVDRKAKRDAHAQLVDEVGEAKAAKLMRQASRRVVRDTF